MGGRGTGRGGATLRATLLALLGLGLCGCHVLPAQHPARGPAGITVAPAADAPILGQVTVAGDVKAPQALAVPGSGLTLADAVERSGGFALGDLGAGEPAPDLAAAEGRTRPTFGGTHALNRTDEFVTLRREAPGAGGAILYHFPLVMVQRDRAGQILLRPGDRVTLQPAQDTSLALHASSPAAASEYLKTHARRYSVFGPLIARPQAYDAPAGQGEHFVISDILGLSDQERGVLVLRRTGRNDATEVFVLPLPDDGLYSDDTFHSTLLVESLVLDGDTFEFTLLERLPIVLEGLVRSTVTVPAPDPTAAGPGLLGLRAPHKAAPGAGLGLDRSVPLRGAATTTRGAARAAGDLLAIPGRAVLGPGFEVPDGAAHRRHAADGLRIVPAPEGRSLALPGLPPGARVIESP